MSTFEIDYVRISTCNNFKDFSYSLNTLKTLWKFSEDSREGLGKLSENHSKTYPRFFGKSPKTSWKVLKTLWIFSEDILEKAPKDSLITISKL